MVGGVYTRRLSIASEEEILRGESTDIYFVRSREVIEKTGMDKEVYAEVHAYSLPRGYQWAIVTGILESATLLEGRNVNVYSMDEGEVFRVYEPVMAIEGRYTEFGVYESSLLGIVRHASSISTKAARIKIKAGDKRVLFFGIRCVHPAISPMVDKYAYLGGCDAVSGVIGAKILGVPPTGTMPHALILTAGDQVTAWKSFDKYMPEDVPRIALCDTFSDERFEALKAAEALGDRLQGVRFDTPGSRRGDMRRIVLESRWALDISGYKNVKIYVSGGLDEEEVEELRDVVDGFGVGTSITFPPSIDLALDIVEVMGRQISKRGKLPGRKQVYRCPEFHDTITPSNKYLDKCPSCGEAVEPLLKPLIINGKLVREVKPYTEIRKNVVEKLKKISSLKDFNPEPILLSSL
ncbi:MAG: nicotinate phosphoribosyltransferase [Aigarchaeota archaeon]|nr:nicotinate phosphoribosyltransferase [Aigarchaeota archaeon]MCX8193493.1 nicotinate phosphoribosyltransferase [Nitrososphaeria archaeon]MDW7986796.1 nicotinate phosphoribosyltransferase [Nitrososphaerota archaeon]